MFKTEDMEGGNMKIKSFLIISVVVISLMAVHCSRSQSSLSPEAVSNKAILNGTVILSTNSATSFGAIQVGVKGTSLYTNPNGNGNFQIGNLPLGNVVVEVSVQSNVSDIQIDNVTSIRHAAVDLDSPGSRTRHAAERDCGVYAWRDLSKDTSIL